MRYLAGKPLERRRATAMALAGACASIFLANGALAQQRGEESKRVYRWTDEKGIVHYGDRVPAEYIRGETTIMNKQGVPVSVRPAQKTPEQFAADEAQQKVLDKERQHDQFLLTTYQSVRDIEMLRDQRLKEMELARRAVQAYVETLQSRMTSLHERVQIFRPYNESPNARRMPDELADEMVRTLKEVAAQRAQLAERLAEDRQLREQFQIDIDRYRTLRAKLASAR